jgi:adenine-specific DNA-methyltransferase
MPFDKTYGPDNPHSLSSRKTELIWEGRYDEYGNRRVVDIARCAMPLQKIETIDAKPYFYLLKLMSYA